MKIRVAKAHALVAEQVGDVRREQHPLVVNTDTIWDEHPGSAVEIHPGGVLEVDHQTGGERLPPGEKIATLYPPGSWARAEKVAE